MPTYTLKGSNLADLKAEAAALYGPAARVISATRVSTGGIGPLLSKKHYELLVSAPERPARDVPLRERVGIAALLEDVDEQEDAANQELSTSRPQFSQLMAGLTANLGTEDEERPDPPQLRSAPGDIVAVVGIGQDAAKTARRMVNHVKTAKLYRGSGINNNRLPAINGKRDAFIARAEGVENNSAVYLAVSCTPERSAADALAGIDTDQVWVVVNAARKHSDITVLMKSVREAARITGIAVTGTAETWTPKSIDGISEPVGWIDGSPLTGAK